ncbi:SLATT domain-containing protein [Shewanella septentrionalis]|uniref:SLATT domain-containing protein n=1 Tax=Shewanella septentrionalis TaxID=2952223 RepID=A0A9X3B3A9_9GAMM|nr:SLATT domain-containing protein [Shewanella septentrionalis]MCT7947598.1 SLATT domain-containing protein [Shewanella septentrionalis]
MDKKKRIEIANLEIDCKIGKDRHFIAADRKNKLRIGLGIFAVIGSAIIASGIGETFLKFLGAFLSQENNKSSLFLEFLGHILPLLVGISTAIIGFLGLEKQTAQHRFVGNSYIEIARKSRSILNSINENNSVEKEAEYALLMEKYLDINKEGEACPTNDNDNKKAMSMNSKKREAIKSKIAEFEKETLDITEKRYEKKDSARKLIYLALKFRMVSFFAWVKLIRKSDYKRYLRNMR